MTEITDKKVKYDPWIFPAKTSRTPGYLIDPVAFFIALVAGPLIVTAFTFWLLFIPVFALFMGGPIYLVIGTPLLLIHLRRNQAVVNDLVWLAFLAVLSLFPVMAIAAWVLGDENLIASGAFFLTFGLLFGPLWAAAFGKIYLSLRRDFYAIARPV